MEFCSILPCGDVHLAWKPHGKSWNEIVLVALHFQEWQLEFSGRISPQSLYVKGYIMQALFGYHLKWWKWCLCSLETCAGILKSSVVRGSGGVSSCSGLIIYLITFSTRFSLTTCVKARISQHDSGEPPTGFSVKECQWNATSIDSPFDSLCGWWVGVGRITLPVSFLPHCYAWRIALELDHHHRPYHISRTWVRTHTSTCW